MKMLQAIAQRRDGKWFASIATQEGVVLEGAGESLIECIDNAINGSVRCEISSPLDPITFADVVRAVTP